MGCVHKQQVRKVEIYKLQLAAAISSQYQWSKLWPQLWVLQTLDERRSNEAIRNVTIVRISSSDGLHMLVIALLRAWRSTKLASNLELDSKILPGLKPEGFEGSHRDDSLAHQWQTQLLREVEFHCSLTTRIIFRPHIVSHCRQPYNV